MKKVSFDDSATIRGDLPYIWQAVTDVASWPRWDPHFVEADMEGPFVAGATGWSRVPGSMRGSFTITEVVPESGGYSTASPMPGGTMYVTLRYEQVEPGRVAVYKKYELHGGSFVPFFKLFYMKPIQRQLAAMFSGLEAEGMRRKAEQEAGR
jgi:hypothetical protein